MQVRGHLWPGQQDIHRAISQLAQRLPPGLEPLASLAYNYLWSWLPDGPEVFRDLDPLRFIAAQENPVRLLQEVTPLQLERSAANSEFVDRVNRVAAAFDTAINQPWDPAMSPANPIAFFCAEFGVHRSLPIYSGGLGILAGDIVKEASDMGLPMVGIGLMYRLGYFHQRLDTGGWQHEYWVDSDPDRLPATLVTNGTGKAIKIDVPVWDATVAAHIWRVDVGRVPLYLLDTHLEENTPVQRWITARLYEGNHDIRLGQYAMMGIGGIRALQRLGIEPSTIHLNEGHAALAAFEMAISHKEAGEPVWKALQRVKQTVVFTTHTPVAAGNETYGAQQFLLAFRNIPDRLGIEAEQFIGQARIHPTDTTQHPGMTPLAIRLARSINGVSRRHGDVARHMWQPMYNAKTAADVPISYVTNGVHLPTWMGKPFRELLNRYLPTGWMTRATEPAIWEAIDDIPAAELWAARTASRRALIDLVRERSATDRLRRGEDLDYVQAAFRTLDPDVLTVGFARRLAAYKRLHLLIHSPGRALALLEDPHPLQLLFAGKAHPMDDGGKRIVAAMFSLKPSPRVRERVAFLEDYDAGLGAALVTGCDVWINLPRPPLEASGTSGMKVVLNGGLNLSVLDGWWAEAYNGRNGWAISGDVDHDTTAQDTRHAEEFYELMESVVVPLFYSRNEQGIPVLWIERIRASLKTLAPRFIATRMVKDYRDEIYATNDSNSRETP